MSASPKTPWPLFGVCSCQVMLSMCLRHWLEMEAVVALFQLCINCLYFATVEEGAKDTTLTLNLGVLDGVLGDHAVLPHPLS